MYYIKKLSRPFLIRNRTAPFYWVMMYKSDTIHMPILGDATYSDLKKKMDRFRENDYTEARILNAFPFLGTWITLKAFMIENKDLIE